MKTSFLKKKGAGFVKRIKRIFSDLPSPRKLKFFFKVLDKKEKILFFFFLLLFAVSSAGLAKSLYLAKTSVVPARGGSVTEGIVGQPRFVNPVLASNDIDWALIELTFSGLMTYDKKGDIVFDLAENIETNEEQTTYTVTLKESLRWSDGEEITADDILFTFETIKDSAYKSPAISNWVGVECEKLADKKVRFEIEKPYYPFKERLVFKIIPEHIFKEVPPENFALTSYNLQKAISSGPYQIKEVGFDKDGQIEQVDLVPNENYHGEKPFIENFTFEFFNNKEDLFQAARAGKVMAVALSEPQELKEVESKSLLTHEALIPRYFGVFLNAGNQEIFKKHEVRKALFQSIEKQKIIDQALMGEGVEVTSPLLPKMFEEMEEKEVEKNEKTPQELLEEAGLVKINGKLAEKRDEFNFSSRLENGSEGGEVEDLQKCLSQFPEIYPDQEVTGYFGEKTEQAVMLFQEKYKEDILDPWDVEEGTGVVSETTREKLNEVCNKSEDEPAVKIVLSTVNQPFLIKTSQILKEEWEELGFEVEIEQFEFNELNREIIKPRDYEMLLFGEMLGMIPDPFPFWHSSRTKQPGLNLALYENETVDELLEKARGSKTKKEYLKNLNKFQEEILKDSPAVLLFTPKFHYVASNKIKGIEFDKLAGPAQRFRDVQSWYVKTKRVWE